MDEDAGSRPPKTLADVSHLFFSKVEDSAEEPAEAHVHPPAVDGDEAPPEVGPRPTRFFVVTGADDAAGKSTVAVNLASALVPFGRVAVFDADPRVPNARYFLGLPSWHYLSPLTGGADAAPNIVTSAGFVVSDWSVDDESPCGESGPGGVIYSDVPESGREPLDFAVVDIPTSRAAVLARLAGHASTFIVTVRPGRSGFESAYGALRTLKGQCGVDRAALVVNRASSEEYAVAFHAKMKAAAERLLSMELHFVGSVLHEPGLGAEQRERGAIVASRSDTATALSLRRIASRVLELTSSSDPPGGVAGPRDRRED